MNKDEILAISRAENKNKDIYEQEVLKQASRSAVVVHSDTDIYCWRNQLWIMGNCF